MMPGPQMTNVNKGSPELLQLPSHSWVFAGSKVFFLLLPKTTERIVKCREGKSKQSVKSLRKSVLFLAGMELVFF